MTASELQSIHDLSRKMEQHSRQLDALQSDMSDIKQIVTGSPENPRSSLVVKMAILDERLKTTNSRLAWNMAIGATIAATLIVAVARGLFG